MPYHWNDKKKWRVWTVDCNDRFTIHTDWSTRAECKKYILGRWNHWPPFAHISQCSTVERFRKLYCE